MLCLGLTGFIMWYKVQGKFLEFNFSVTDFSLLNNAITRCLKHNIVKHCNPNEQEFFSNVFPTFKNDGSAHVIFKFRELKGLIHPLHIKKNTIISLPSPTVLGRMYKVFFTCVLVCCEDATHKYWFMDLCFLPNCSFTLVCLKLQD